jgi:hypothetical protein
VYYVAVVGALVYIADQKRSSDSISIDYKATPESVRITSHTNLVIPFPEYLTAIRRIFSNPSSVKVECISRKAE